MDWPLDLGRRRARVYEIDDTIYDLISPRISGSEEQEGKRTIGTVTCWTESTVILRLPRRGSIVIVESWWSTSVYIEPNDQFDLETNTKICYRSVLYSCLKVSKNANVIVCIRQRLLPLQHPLHGDQRGMALVRGGVQSELPRSNPRRTAYIYSGSHPVSTFSTILRHHPRFA